MSTAAVSTARCTRLGNRGRREHLDPNAQVAVGEEGGVEYFARERAEPLRRWLLHDQHDGLSLVAVPYGRTPSEVRLS